MKTACNIGEGCDKTHQVLFQDRVQSSEECQNRQDSMIQGIQRFSGLNDPQDSAIQRMHAKDTQDHGQQKPSRKCLKDAGQQKPSRKSKKTQKKRSQRDYGPPSGLPLPPIVSLTLLFLLLLLFLFFLEGFCKPVSFRHFLDGFCQPMSFSHFLNVFCYPWSCVSLACIL